MISKFNIILGLSFVGLTVRFVPLSFYPES